MHLYFVDVFVFVFMYIQVGESHRPHFRPGLEGGSSDDESQPGAQFTDPRTGIEHRCSAEGQVIDLPITGIQFSNFLHLSSFKSSKQK